MDRRNGNGKRRPRYQPTALPWRTEKLDPETGELKSEFVMLDVGVMMSEAYRDLSSTAKNVLNVVIARFYREAAWRGNGKLNLGVSVSIAVQDCEKLGNPLNWRTLRRSLIELDEAGFIDLDLPKRKGKKTHFRRSDRWEGAEAGSCPKMHEMHTSDMHEMHTGPNLRDLMKGKVLREDLGSTPKPTGKVSLQYQKQVWSNIFEGKDPSTPADLARCIIILAGHPNSCKDIEKYQRKLARKIAALGVKHSMDVCLKIAGSVAVAKPWDFYRRFFPHKPPRKEFASCLN